MLPAFLCELWRSLGQPRTSFAHAPRGSKLLAALCGAAFVSAACKSPGGEEMPTDGGTAGDEDTMTDGDNPEGTEGSTDEGTEGGSADAADTGGDTADTAGDNSEDSESEGGGSETGDRGDSDGGDSDDGADRGDSNGDGDGTDGSEDGGSDDGGDDGDEACAELVNDPTVNWRESDTLTTDQEIVECLASSLGKPVGFGENATGGYDPAGASSLVVIEKGSGTSVEQQVLEAISSDDHRWIVFDKDDFATETEVAMYRLACEESSILAALDNATSAQCRDPETWCTDKGIPSADCLQTFFNDRLNDSSLPIRNEMIYDNTTIDGRGARVSFLFNGFQIGADSGGASTHVSHNVILTNLRFAGVGHVEDHDLDPDMIRSTGESHDIWIHQNTFYNTGDSAFDVKVGAYDITISFNRLIDIKRAALHGSSDDRLINEQITTTIHDNLFVTTDTNYASSDFDTLRRVPLMRRGQSHIFNNVFYNYRKDILSVRVGGRIAFEDNMVLNNADEAAAKGDDAQYFIENLLRDFREGGLEISGSQVWFSDASCQLQGSPGDLTASYGSTPDMHAQYGAESQSLIDDNRFTVGQDLADYVYATTGRGAMVPYNSEYTLGRDAVIDAAPDSCQ